MKIETKLRINAFLSVFLSAILIAVLAFSSYRIVEAVREVKVADMIEDEVSEVYILVYDFALRHTVSSRLQWKEKYDSLGARIDRGRDCFREQHKTVEKMAEMHRALGVSFSRVIGFAGGHEMAHSSIEGKEAQMVAQCTASALALFDQANNLMNASNEKIVNTVRNSLLLIMFLAILKSLAVSGVSFFLGRNISASLKRLKDGAEMIAGGHFERRLEIKGDDEVRDLSSAYNNMTERLEVSYSILKKEVAERIEAQAALQRMNEELEARVEERTKDLTLANKELESFSYSVSHDLRAPLRHVAGFVELLQKNIAVSLDETSLRHLNTISAAAKKMGLLIDDLLTFSRIGRSSMKTGKVGMETLLNECMEDMRDELEEREIEWKVGALPHVFGDASMLKLVLANLISNAVKFTGARSRAVIEIGCTEEKGEFIFFVKDNGAGFDMKYHDKLFNVFQRLHTEREFEGTGIGLANVRRIISRHGGRTWAEGTVGAGATFYFTLPVPAFSLAYKNSEEENQ